MKKLLKSLLAASMLMSGVAVSEPVFAFDAPLMNFTEERNFAMEGVPSAYNSPISYWGPDKLIDGVINRDADKPEQSRWSSEAGAPGWVKIDLQQERTFDEFLCAFENDKVRQFHIDISNDDQSYETIFTSEDLTDGHPMDSTVELSEPVTARYVKLTIDSLISGAYPSVSMYEFEILGDEEYVNMAPESTATANHVETGTSFDASRTIDESFDKSSRWSSDYTDGQNILTYTFEEEKTIASVILEWERLNATSYHIEVLQDGEWVNVKDLGLATLFSERINLDEPVVTTGLRIVIDEFFSEAENRDGELIDYMTVSLYEVGIYDKPLYIAPVDEITSEDIANALTVEPVGADDTAMQMPEVPEGFEISFVGADYEQIVARDMTITKPLTGQNVVVNFEVTRTYEDEDGNEVVDKATSPAITVYIPGIHDEADSVNEKPAVLPELQQWFGYEGEFSVTDSSKIVVDPSAAEFMETAEIFAEDYKDIMEKDIEVVSGSDPAAGDFYFTISDETLDKETYVMEVTDFVKVEATEATGAYWSTRTILQILKQTGSTINKGITKDYPKYEVRGFMLDVARRPFHMDFLEELVKTMSWYKLNNFHVHLNDNCFGKLEDGKTPDYSGFRLESDVPNLTSTDYYYTKDEFRSFILNSRKVGVDITPEFDTPGHSGAFIRARPDLARADSNEYLDVENPEAIEFVKSVFAEYLTGDNPVFPEGTVVHIGTDEYKRGNKEAFRKYQDELLKFIRDEMGYTPRVFGSQTENSGTTPITVDGVQMDLWYTGYANPREMYELGYDCINMNDGDLYIVPGAGYYYDYLNQSHIYGTWQPNKIGNFTIPVGSEQMLGSTFGVWNDKTGPSNDNGTSDVEVFDRIFAITPTFAAKLWGDIEDYSINDINEMTETLAYAPNSNPTYDVDSVDSTVMRYNFNNENGKDYSGNGYDLSEQVNVSYDEGRTSDALTLKGNESYVETPVENLGINSTIEFWVKRDANSTDEEQILFESDKGAIKAVQKETGKLGFSREWHDYSFNYELPKGEWVKIKLDTALTVTKLYVNDELVDTLGINATGGKWASLVIPLNRIGSTEKAFQGQIDDVIVEKKVAECTATATSEQSQDKAANAIDGNTSSMWHTKWDGSDELPQSLTLEYSKPREIGGFTYLPRQDGGVNGNITKYQIEVSMDGKEYTVVASGEWADNAEEKSVEFEPCTAKFVRLTALEGHGGWASAAEVSVTRIGADKDNLEKMIRIAENLNEEDYTTDSWAAFAAALNDAKATAENPDATQEEVDDAYAALESAIDQLQDASAGTPASDAAIQALRNMVEKAVALGSDDAALNEAITNAQAVLAKEAPTSTEVVTALLDLSEAMQALNIDESEDALRVDVQATIDFIKENILTNVGNVRPGKVQALKDAVAAAQTLVNDPTATADALKAANKAMTKAAQELWEIVTKAELEALIEAANGYLDGDYTAESLEALQAAIESAQAVAINDDATTAEVTEAITNLSNAIAGLESITLDTSALEHEIELVTEMIANLDNYVPSSVEGLQDKLDAAKNTLTSATTQAEIDEATKTLREARLTARTKADVSALEELVAYAKSLDLSTYTAESADSVLVLADRALAKMNDPEITQDEVDALAEELQSAIDALEPVSVGSANADTTNTAAADMSAMMFALLAAAGAAAALAYRRKRS